MKVLVDTNVILDVLLEREPFYRASLEILAMSEMGQIEGFVSAITIPTIYYLVRKEVGSDKAREAVKRILAIFKVAPVDEGVLLDATRVPFRDYEDAVIYCSTLRVGAACIITRNVRDFRDSQVPVVTPLEFLRRF